MTNGGIVYCHSHSAIIIIWLSIIITWFISIWSYWLGAWYFVPESNTKTPVWGLKCRGLFTSWRSIDLFDGSTPSKTNPKFCLQVGKQTRRRKATSSVCNLLDFPIGFLDKKIPCVYLPRCQGIFRNTGRSVKFVWVFLGNNCMRLRMRVLDIGLYLQQNCCQYVCIYALLYVCVYNCVCVCVCMYVCMFIHVCLYMYVKLWVCMGACVYVCFFW